MMSGEDFSSSAFPYAEQPSLKLKQPLNVRIFWVDILTFDGFFGTKFDILKPRWLPTAEVLLAEPGARFDLLLRQALRPTQASEVSADQLAHVHAQRVARLHTLSL
jgi:hypothetical protein